MTISVTVRNSRNERKLKKKIGNTTTRVKNAMKERFEVIPYVIVQYTPVFSVQEVVWATDNLNFKADCLVWQARSKRGRITAHKISA